MAICLCSCAATPHSSLDLSTLAPPILAAAHCPYRCHIPSHALQIHRILCHAVDLQAAADDSSVGIAQELGNVLSRGAAAHQEGPLRNGFGPDLFYVPTNGEVTGPPFARVYGYYRNKPKKDWKTISLSDDDIISLVNLKWMSEHYGYSPEKIIRMRSGNGEFISINEEIRRGKERFNPSTFRPEGKSSTSSRNQAEELRIDPQHAFVPALKSRAWRSRGIKE